MAALQKMQNKQYVVEREKIGQHFKRVGVPSNAIIHYWYEVDTPSVPGETEEKKKRKSIRTSPAYGMWKDRDEKAMGAWLVGHFEDTEVDHLELPSRIDPPRKTPFQ